MQASCRDDLTLDDLVAELAERPGIAIHCSQRLSAADVLRAMMNFRRT